MVELKPFVKLALCWTGDEGDDGTFGPPNSLLVVEKNLEGSLRVAIYYIRWMRFQKV